MNNDELREGAEAGGMGESDADWCISDVVETTSAMDKVTEGSEYCSVCSWDANGVSSNECMNLSVLVAVEHASLNADGSVPPIPAASSANATASASAGVADFEEEDLALDSATLGSGASAAVASSSSAPGPSASIRSARRYDVSITYDKYYQTPRIWLFGYDEAGSPLTPERIFDDVISDYSNRTVTLDPHPHLSLPHASVHPCQHGVAMKRVVEELMAGGSPAPSTDQYLFIFLKFMQSVIPTIEFDNTVDVQMKKASS
jgi:ubiquitin-like-conjugating enzyme ATG3